MARVAGFQRLGEAACRLLRLCFVLPEHSWPSLHYGLVCDVLCRGPWRTAATTKTGCRCIFAKAIEVSWGCAAHLVSAAHT